NFTVRRFDPSGQVQHTLTAQQLRHYPDDDSTELDQPLLLYRGKQSPTRISADRAQLLKDGKEAILRDNVRVLREASPGNPEMT
ncbi:LPS export ABC transporter periplasmic protein LptC, partial [Acinetobacter baumannii]